MTANVRSSKTHIKPVLCKLSRYSATGVPRNVQILRTLLNPYRWQKQA